MLASSNTDDLEVFRKVGDGESDFGSVEDGFPSGIGWMEWVEEDGRVFHHNHYK